MNKIVNGVANDYEFPQLDRITIPTESECYLGIIREYQREVERLNNIINELKEYLKLEIAEWQDVDNIPTRARVEEDKDILDKIKELEKGE